MQKLKNSNHACFAIGGFTSLNYFKFNEEIHYFNYVPNTVGGDHVENNNYSEKNKIGIGICIDIEIKQFIFDNMSLFSRFKGEIIQYDGPIKGIIFFNERINNVDFNIGLRINLKKTIACSY